MARPGPYAFSVGTILLAVVLTDIARAQESDWSAWTASLGLTALGLLAILAGNPFTLILTWAALDFAELLVMFWHVRSSEGRRQAGFALTGKVLSLFLLLWAWIIAGQSGSSARFDDLPDRASLYLLLAALDSCRDSAIKPASNPGAICSTWIGHFAAIDLGCRSPGPHCSYFPAWICRGPGAFLAWPGCLNSYLWRPCLDVFKG